MTRDLYLWGGHDFVSTPGGVNKRREVSVCGGLAGYRQINQFVPSATVMFTVIADSTTQSNIIARSEVPMAGSGKVAAGATVNIRLTGFPYREYGSLTTSVDKIASLPVTLESEEPGYEMEMRLPDTLETNYGNFIPFKHNMTGTARIITKDRSFLSRVFEQ